MWPVYIHHAYIHMYIHTHTYTHIYAISFLIFKWQLNGISRYDSSFINFMEEPNARRGGEKFPDEDYVSSRDN